MHEVKVFATADPKDLFSDPHLRFVTRLDWKKIPKILSGEWPLPIPKQCVASPATRDEFEALLEEALCQEELVCDSEYIVSNSMLTHVGAAWLSSSTSPSPEKGPSSTSISPPALKGFQLEWVHGSATNVER